MNPRCPTCDIELDCSSDRWMCPLCGQTPTPEQYVKVQLPTAIAHDLLAIRDTMTAVSELIVAIAADEPEMAVRLKLGQVYRAARDLAECADDAAHGTDEK